MTRSNNSRRGRPTMWHVPKWFKSARRKRERAQDKDAEAKGREPEKRRKSDRWNYF